MGAIDRLDFDFNSTLHLRLTQPLLFFFFFLKNNQTAELPNEHRPKNTVNQYKLCCKIGWCLWIPQQSQTWQQNRVYSARNGHKLPVDYALRSGSAFTATRFFIFFFFTPHDMSPQACVRNTYCLFLMFLKRNTNRDAPQLSPRRCLYSFIRTSSGKWVCSVYVPLHTGKSNVSHHLFSA